MDTLTIFLTQSTLSVVVFSLLAKWFIGPWLAEKTIHVALLVLTFPHAMRHVGLSFLVPADAKSCLQPGPLQSFTPMQFNNARLSNVRSQLPHPMEAQLRLRLTARLI